MIWFWTIYISAGVWILMPGLVFACGTEESHWTIKAIGSIIAIIAWPAIFLVNDDV